MKNAPTLFQTCRKCNNFEDPWSVWKCVHRWDHPDARLEAFKTHMSTEYTSYALVNSQTCYW